MGAVNGFAALLESLIVWLDEAESMTAYLIHVGLLVAAAAAGCALAGRIV